MEPAVKDLDLTAIDLVIDDRDPQALFDAALARFLELAPTARPRNGSVEAILLEAAATASADVIYALNRIPALTVEGIISLYGVTRYAGAPAAGQVTVTLDGARTMTVAAGQRLLDPASGLVLQVTAATSITSAASIVLPVATAEPGGAGNALTAGTAVDLLDSIPGAVSAQVTTGLTGGADPETDSSYLDRASTVFARVTSSLVLPVHFTAYLLEDPRVGRATSIDLYEPGGTIGSDTGHITCFTYGRGAQLASTVRTELQDAMAAISSAIVTVHVEPAGIVTQNIALTVHALPGYATGDVQDAVEAALRAWMSPDAWTWGRDILVSEISDVAADVPGVDYVTTVATPSGTVTVSASQLALAGTVTVTVTT